MGNCQAAEAATVLIQHSGGKVERIYWSISASKVMADNPGHYVAALIVSSTSISNNNYNNCRRSDPPSSSSSSSSYSSSSSSSSSTKVKYLKLLPPDGTLHIGHVYRLVSFEEVLREFKSNKRVQLDRLGKEGRERSSRHRRRGASSNPPADPKLYDAGAKESPVDDGASSSAASGGGRRPGSRRELWRPALETIAEVDRAPEVN